MEIKAIIIDDEKKSREALAAKLEKSFPEVKVIGEAENAQEGIRLINSLSPELVFLDIEMPVMNGLTMLQSLEEIKFEVIFTTAYDQYAINAIRFSALDYLLKPVEITELENSIQNFKKKREKNNQHITSEQIQLLLQNFQSNPALSDRIALPTSDGLQMVNIDSIVRLQSDSNYTMFYFSNGKNLMVSKTMKEYEEILEPHQFFRVHNSHIVNLKYVNKYVKGEGGYAIMEDGSSIEVSVRRKQGFIQKLVK